jgi:hypothetical protein
MNFMEEQIKELTNKVDELHTMVAEMKQQMAEMRNVMHSPPEVPNTASHDYGWLNTGKGMKPESRVAFGDFPLDQGCSFIGGGRLGKDNPKYKFGLSGDDAKDEY